MSEASVNYLKRDTAERLLRVINKILSGRKHPRDYGTGEPLYMSEIEVIREISAKKAANLTELADTLCVSKATLSPIVNKLVNKEYLVKSQSTENAKIKLLSITTKGDKVIEGLSNYADKFDFYMSETTQKDLRSYIDFLTRLESFLDDVDEEFRP